MRYNWVFPGPIAALGDTSFTTGIDIESFFAPKNAHFDTNLYKGYEMYDIILSGTWKPYLKLCYLIRPCSDICATIGYVVQPRWSDQRTKSSKLDRSLKILSWQSS